ncbi:MAG: twin-arginine translocase subunit TatC [Dehalococcoidales bacterium]|nr:twin-arginine translocase subunit TatC [Dehalococcoidales bacterium]
MENDNPINILEHFKEIKKRFLRYFIILGIFTLVSLVFFKKIIQIFIEPANKIILNSGAEGQIVFGKVTEAWGAAARTSIILGISLSIPFLLGEIIFFLRPGLRGKEKIYIYLLIPLCFIFFVIGALFSYFFVIPSALNFLITLGDDIAQPMINIGPLTSLMFSLMFWMGIIFQIPLIMFLLGSLKIISYKMLSKYRRWVILISFILGAIITPTVDPITQITVALPMILLFELGLILIKISEPDKKSWKFYLGIFVLFLIVILVVLGAIITRFDLYRMIELN